MHRLALAALFLLLHACVCAQSTKPQLTLSIAGPQTSFQVGERIPLLISFTSAEPNRFELNGATYDRSGRMSYEQFSLSPSVGWTDPLHAYFHSARGFIMGGLTTMRPLSLEPTLIALNLNEWVRFDKPGVYQLTLTSDRVSDVRASSERAALTVTSNAITLKIVAADPAWQRNKLRQIELALAARPEPKGISSEARRDAVADLRFLQAPAAIRLLTQHIREDESSLIYDCAFGLMGLPSSLHQLASEELRKRITEPSFPVSQWVLTTLAVLQLPTADSTSEQRDEAEELVWRLVAESLSSKQGAALAATAQTLLQIPPALLTSELKAQLAGVLSAHLGNLPRSEQARQLEYNWDSLRSPALIPLLKHLATIPLSNPDDNRSDVVETRELKAIALRRWYELDPQSALQAAIVQVGSAQPSLPARSLFFLPKDLKLPQFERVWADAFLATDDYRKEATLASLMTRFGTGAEVSVVRAKAAQNVGNWACMAQAAALAYLVKFDPASARPLVEQAIAERGKDKTACNHTVLQEIARYANDPILNELAIASLDDPDPEVVNDSLIHLIDYGDESARQPVWERYLAWSDRWRGHEDELEARPVDGKAHWEGIALGQNLAHTLLASQGWIATPELTAAVLSKCVGKQVCEQTHNLLQFNTSPLNVTAYSREDQRNFGVGPFQVKSLDLLDAKIAQFPRGTRFMLIPSSPPTADQKALEQQVTEIIMSKGMSISKAP